jgi:hypothetical protein
MSRTIRALAVSCLWLAPLLAFSLAFASDWPTCWNHLLIPSWKGPFMDLSSITSAVEIQRRGGDPLIANSSDVYQRPMNYPRIWLHLFSWLHITRGTVPFIGIAFCVLYLICISWLIAKSASWAEALLLLAAGMSLAPWMAMERGNTDLFVFALILLGFATAGKYMQPAAYFFATLLKVFPIAALIIDAARRPAKERAAPITFAALAAALLAWQWRDLQAIRHATPVSTYLSYGLLSLKSQAGYLSGALLAASCVFAVLIIAVVWWTRPNFEEPVLRSKAGEMFLLFGGIYAFTFAIGSNWNYRLIFLLPTLPFAVDLVRSPRHKAWGIAYIVTLLVAENSFALGTYEGIPLGDVATFTLFVMFAAIFVPMARKLVMGASSAQDVPLKAPASSQEVRL